MTEREKIFIVQGALGYTLNGALVAEVLSALYKVLGISPTNESARSEMEPLIDEINAILNAEETQNN